MSKIYVLFPSATTDAVSAYEVIQAGVTVFEGQQVLSVKGGENMRAEIADLIANDPTLLTGI